MCPKCLLKSRRNWRSAKQKLADSYGKIPVAEFDEMQAALVDEPTAANQEETLREDYEFYLDPECVFTAEYSCRCSKCSFGHIFKHKETVSLG